MKVSVCMATFNGRRYIGEQMDSIRAQLRPGDEVVVNDDGSNDGTVKYLTDLADARIKLHQNARRLGHAANFGACAARATGDVLFFADQDDRWHPAKIATVLKIFTDNPGVTLVHHGLNFIDNEGQPLERRILPTHPGPQKSTAFLVRQVIRGQLFGCAIAIRRSALDFCLPLPANVYAHDHWFAIANAVCGRIYLSDAILIDYRQHQNNLTPRRSAPIMRQMRWRLASARQVAEALRRRRTKPGTGPEQV